MAESLFVGQQRLSEQQAITIPAENLTTYFEPTSNNVTKKPNTPRPIYVMQAAKAGGTYTVSMRCNYGMQHQKIIDNNSVLTEMYDVPIAWKLESHHALLSITSHEGEGVGRPHAETLPITLPANNTGATRTLSATLRQTITNRYFTLEIVQAP